jgi:hypothetical protein
MVLVVVHKDLWSYLEDNRAESEKEEKPEPLSLRGTCPDCYIKFY